MGLPHDGQPPVWPGGYGGGDVKTTDGMANYAEWMQERMDSGMDPNALVAELRDVASRWRADKMDTTSAMGMMASLFNDLDEWLLDGRPFPVEWRKGRPVQD